jgi:hypothetical protein
MPRRVVRTLALAAVVFVGTSRPASAGDDFGGSAGQDPSSVTSWVVGSPGGGVPGGGSGCSWSSAVPSSWVPGQPVAVGSVDARSVPELVAWQQTCGNVVSLVWVPSVSPQQLAPFARQELSALLPMPVPVVGPPKEHALVNFREWLAVQPLTVVSATVGTPAVSVTASATPVSMLWDMGDGNKVDCPNFGQVWAGQPLDFLPLCSHVYTWYSAEQPGDVYRASVTVVWNVSWRATSGEGGTLGDLTTTTAVPFHVGELQTVYVGGPNEQPISVGSGSAP